MRDSSRFWREKPKQNRQRRNHMKLLFYSHDWAPSIGGVQTSLMLLAEGLAKRPSREVGGIGDSFEVTLVTQTPRGEMNDAALPYRVVRLPKPSQLLRLIREADLLHLAGVSLVPLCMGWLLRKHIVIEHHFYDAICPNGLLFYEPLQKPCSGHFLARRYRECVRCNSGISGLWKSVKMLGLTFPRHWLSQRVAGNIAISAHVCHRLNLPRSKVVYYGVRDLSSGRSEIQNPSYPLRFAYVGRLVSIKGVHLIMEAARKLCGHGVPFHVQLIGDGPERSRLEAMSSAFGLKDRMTFLGFLEGKDLRDAVDEVDVVLMPSIWEETAGLAAMEQMMRGKATIVADIGGVAEVVADTGLKFPYGDADALAACMRRFVEDPDLVRRFGEAARARASSLFNEEQMVAARGAFYVQIGHRNSSERRN